MALVRLQQCLRLTGAFQSHLPSEGAWRTDQSSVPFDALFSAPDTFNVHLLQVAHFEALSSLAQLNEDSISSSNGLDRWRDLYFPCSMDPLKSGRVRLVGDSESSGAKRSLHYPGV